MMMVMLWKHCQAKLPVKVFLLMIHTKTVVGISAGDHQEGNRNLSRLLAIYIDWTEKKKPGSKSIIKSCSSQCLILVTSSAVSIGAYSIVKFWCIYIICTSCTSSDQCYGHKKNIWLAVAITRFPSKKVEGS